MRSNYRPIGDYIELVDERNADLKVKTLLGLSISKQFIPSVANTVGTNMRNYKIIRKNQFACSTMQVRRDRKMPVALLKDIDEAIVSQAYPVFEISDEKKLLPEYLMMWFSREEFDRHAEFLAVGGVRGTLEWEDFLSMELPVPSLEKQQEIVNEYKVIADRIKLKEQLNQKLEATAQALYRHWFVDFEFPANLSGTLSGDEGYKSSGGAMVYNEELDREIPEGWEVKSLSQLIIGNPENFTNSDDFTNIQYLETSNITKNKIDEIKILDLAEDKIPSRAKRKVKHNDIIYSTVRPALCHYGILRNPFDNLIVSTGFAVLRAKDKSLTEIIYQFITSGEITNALQSKAEMSVSTYPSIKLEDIMEIKIALPTENLIGGFKHINNRINHNNLESQILNELQAVLLSKMSTVGETATVQDFRAIQETTINN